MSGVNVLTVNTSTAGASVDVEVRIQVDTASTVQHKRLEALKCLEIIEAFIESAGNNHSGANLPIP